MYRHAFRVLAQRAAPVATAAAATALVVAPPSRCDWWSSKKPSAPAPAAAAAAPVAAAVQEASESVSQAEAMDTNPDQRGTTDGKEHPAEFFPSGAEGGGAPAAPPS